VWLGWLGIFEFDEEIVDVPQHTDATAPVNIVPFYVNTCKLVACHVELYTLKFLKQLQEMIEVFDSHVFNIKVINNEAKLDGMLFVAPETRIRSHFVVAFGLETGAKEIVGQDTCLGKTITSLADFEVDPPITILTNEIVFFNELLRYVRNFDTNLFRVGHGRVGVEVLQVN
jgi:hypothetical protein